MGKTIITIVTSFTTIVTSFVLSLVWITMTIIFGLLQLWLIMLGKFISGGGIQAVNAAQDIIVKDNVLLFFSIAIISAMTVDFLMMLQKTHPSITKVNIMTLIFAFFIVVFSVAVYLHVYNLPADEMMKSVDTFQRILKLNSLISTLTLTYVFGLKWYQFYNRL